MIADDCWLTAGWSFVRAQLPPPPVAVLELGCGGRGGFVPVLLDAGYDAVGVDPDAPEEPSYHRVEFERFEVSQPVQVVVASASLHHVADLDQVLDRVTAVLEPAGQMVVIEYAWERFDEATARWCFARLPVADSGSVHAAHRAAAADRPAADIPAADIPAEADAAVASDTPDAPSADGAGWLHCHRDGWTASGQSWTDYRRGWAQAEGLHRGDAIVRGLDERFERLTLGEGPYVFCDLVDTTETDEQAAIDAGEIRPVGIRYVGRRR